MVDMYRQWDLLFVRVEDIPKGTRKRRNNVILEGEATGHTHRVKNGGFLYEIPSWKLVDHEDALFFEVMEPESEKAHEEHGTLNISKGIFQIIRQKEFNKVGKRLVTN